MLAFECFCAENLWNVYPLRYSKLNRLSLQAICSNWTCFEKRLSYNCNYCYNCNNLQLFYHSMLILWFYLFWSIFSVFDIFDILSHKLPEICINHLKSLFSNNRFTQILISRTSFSSNSS